MGTLVVVMFCGGIVVPYGDGWQMNVVEPCCRCMWVSGCNIVIDKACNRTGSAMTEKRTCRDVVMSYRSASSVDRMLRKWCVSIPFKRPVSCAFAVKYAHMSAHCARPPAAAA